MTPEGSSAPRSKQWRERLRKSPCWTKGGQRQNAPASQQAKDGEGQPSSYPGSLRRKGTMFPLLEGKLSHHRWVWRLPLMLQDILRGGLRRRVLAADHQASGGKGGNRLLPLTPPSDQARLAAVGRRLDNKCSTRDVFGGGGLALVSRR